MMRASVHPFINYLTCSGQTATVAKRDGIYLIQIL